MHNRSSKPRRSRDTNILAKSIVDEVTADTHDEDVPNPDEGKNPAAVALGRLGGKKGGKARAAKLSPERRREIAKKAAEKRWSRDIPD